MWVRKSSIRPVPEYARVSRHVLMRVRDGLLSSGAGAQNRLDEAFDEFEAKQPMIAAHVAEKLNRPMGEAATALGFFLSLAIWLAFRDAFPGKMRAVSEDEMRGTLELFALDEKLRETEECDHLETDDVVKMEQPALVEFIHEHIQATLNMQEQRVEASDLQVVYRMVLIELLALSYSVITPAGYPLAKAEAQA